MITQHARKSLVITVVQAVFTLRRVILVLNVNQGFILISIMIFVNTAHTHVLPVLIRVLYA